MTRKPILLKTFLSLTLVMLLVVAAGAAEKPRPAQPVADDGTASALPEGSRDIQKAPVAPAATYTVPGDYATIQAAIDAAATGDTITVAAGTYAEAIIIDGKDLTITGAGAGSSIITGTAGQTQYIVRITNGAVVYFSGFTVDGTGIDREYGIYADAGSDGDIHDNHVTGIYWSSAAGLAIRRQECYIDVTDNVVDDFGRIGIYTRDDVIGNTDTGVISGNTVTGLGGLDAGRLSYGISVYSGNPTIDGNDIYDCLSGADVSAWASAGLDPWTGSTSIISNNNFYNCQVGILSNSASPVLSGNTFTGMVDYDVRMDYFVKGNPTPHWAEYYNTIQEGIDAVPVSPYLCILWVGVYSGGGTYAEALNVNKSLNMWGDSRGTVLIDPSGLSVNNAGIYVAADDVLVSGFTLDGGGVNPPRYGVKFGDYDGCYLDDAEIRNVYRSGMDALGATNLSISDVEAHDNGGNGLQLCDCVNVTFDGVTTYNNAWGGVGIFTWGEYTPIGVSGVVFTGTNSFGETAADVGSIYLEEGNSSDPANPHPITYSTDIGDGADVTVQLADVTHTLTGNSDNDNNYTRFYETLADAQTAAAGAVSHILDGRYITELAGTDLYVPANLGGVGPAVAAADPGDVVHVDPGTFTTDSQVVVDKDLTLEGAGSEATTINLSFDTGTSGDARGWFLVTAGSDFELAGVTLDGTGHDVYQGIRNMGLGSCTDVVFNEIKHSASPYFGTTIAAFGTGPVDVTGCTFTEIGRIGVLYYSEGVNVSEFTGNTYVGKGPGDWLDYCLDISAGAIVNVTDNYITGCRGVASSDGSTSGAVMVTTYYGAGTEAVITGNTLTDNSTGILVGYDGSDVSVVEAHNNAIYGNDHGVSTTAPVVDALNNWWGDATGPYHATLNPGGLGNDVSDNVLFDPWMGAPNELSVSPAYGTTTCTDPITFTFRFDQVGLDEVRGIEATFQIDGAVATVANVSTDIVEGSYLPGFGATTFYQQDLGGGVYKVTTTILGGTTGATGSGDLFAVTFTPAAEGLTDITITDLQVRDVDNVPLFSAGVVGGELRIDCTVPTMEPIVEPEGVCYNVAPTFADFGFDDDQALDRAEYRIDAGGWVTLFAGLNAAEWNDDGWTLPGFGGLSEGPHTVYFRVADMAGNENGEGTPDTYSWSFIKDTVPPAPPTGFAAMPGHDKVHLTWTDPVGDASFVGVEIRLVAWGDYPQYLTAPSYPADHLSGTLVTQASGGMYDDDPRSPRDIYYYAAFSYDCAGNYSAFDAGAADRSTSYWLGDIYAGYDGYVNFNDLGDFSNAFGTTEGGGGWNAEADFGPTDDWSRFGIPLPDDAIDFEDLMIFSMNYGNVDPAGFDFKPEEKTPENLENMVSFELVPVSDDDGTVISVVMSSRAATLKGAKLVMETAAGCEIVNVSKGDAYAKRGDIFFGTIPSHAGTQICVSALGVDKPLAGSGEIAKILVRGDGPVNVSISEADIRDTENRQFVLEGTGGYEGPAIPDADALSQNFPNPFNPATTIAFDLAKAAEVSIGVYDVSGRLVRTLVDGKMAAGSHEVNWNGTNNAGTGVPSGMYFYRMITSEGFTATRKMILLR